ncbi:Parathyroid hormone [Oryzias melastigma]|uniref:Parathyroid hormone n=1 Tax=Oryzias melastigma TaxID=30732 RepID=A0A834BZ13_ORYME|nr:Parathyroid hormone [Oryzias melastigma]
MIDATSETTDGSAATIQVQGGAARLRGKRSISEMQLMHNLQEHKQVGERQDWLQEKLKKIISPSNKPQQGQAASVKSLLLKEEFKKSI